MNAVKTLNSEDRCPHCKVSRPLLVEVYRSSRPLPRSDGGVPLIWSAFTCTTCGSLICASLYNNEAQWSYDKPIEVFPKLENAHIDIPEIPRKFLQQAMDTLHAPDAAAVMAGSAVDAMLKELGLDHGSLYSRIDKARQDGLITEGMAKWAHAVRLGSNRPRHSDVDNPHISATETKNSVNFAKSLGDFLFVLTAQVNRGLDDTKRDEDEAVY